MHQFSKNKFATFLIAQTSNQKFVRTGNFCRTVGDRLGEWTVLVPLPFTPDGDEQWACVNQDGKFAVCIADKTKDEGQIVPVEDLGHFLFDIKPLLGYVRQFLPKILTEEMFRTVANKHDSIDVFVNRNGTGTAIWEKACNSMLICYGRLLEMAPNPNEVAMLDNSIRISNLKSLE